MILKSSLVGGSIEIRNISTLATISMTMTGTWLNASA
jgi:hypothetical protein